MLSALISEHRGWSDVGQPIQAAETLSSGSSRLKAGRPSYARIWQAEGLPHQCRHTALGGAGGSACEKPATPDCGQTAKLQGRLKAGRRQDCLPHKDK
jgi:hypothetical protein